MLIVKFQYNDFNLFNIHIDSNITGEHIVCKIMRTTHINAEEEYHVKKLCHINRWNENVEPIVFTNLNCAEQNGCQRKYEMEDPGQIK